MRVMVDHPGWSNGRRTLVNGRTTWYANLDRKRFSIYSRTDQDDLVSPTLDTHTPQTLGSQVPAELSQTLLTYGPVHRVRTPDLWEALATAIIRQVIRAEQARLMCQRFCHTHGQPGPYGEPAGFPQPEQVLDLSDSDFAELGMKFKARPLRAAAKAMVEYGHKWQEMYPDTLVAEVQSVPRIGPWTAGAAIADWSGDFSLYPYGDMAVRKWASVAAPTIDWPTDEPTFAAWWRSFTTSPAELSTLTVLTLALGGARGTEPPTT